ncbi:Uncharacterized protein GBIM_19109 [Gryllus bimaculatus]|nr:Uncharacterized protein GBIM_19109 [Gryllus bimaculatus]
MGSKVQHYCLKWNNYQTHIADICFQSLEAGSMVDVTLCAEGQCIHAHRIVLSACSTYFQNILSNSMEVHPYIILSDMSYEDIKCIIEFVYRGEISLTADRFTSVLKTAEDLRISGLMEVGNYWPDVSSEDSKAMTWEVWDAVEEPMDTCTDSPSVSVYVDQSDGSLQAPLIDAVTVQDPVEVLVITEKDPVPGKPRKRKRDPSKKDYTEETLTAALQDLKSGRSLLETSAAHHIPRSTLYVRARSQSIPIVPSRQDHPREKIQAAVQAVSEGASLQQASKLFKIPKTVLWRRVQKEVGNYSGNKRGKPRESYGFEKKRAAIMALERGEKLSKVSSQYQIPRATLSREKTRLVESGRLPWTSRKKRQSEPNDYKELRLNEAVAACREGKMSQACASQRFQVPKTTIWRRLKDVRTAENTPSIVREKTDGNVQARASHENVCPVSQLQEQQVFSFSEVSSHIPVTYMDESNFTDSSLIILTSNPESEIALQENSQLIIGSDVPSNCTEARDCQGVARCQMSENSEYAAKCP